MLYSIVIYLGVGELSKYANYTVYLTAHQLWDNLLPNCVSAIINVLKVHCVFHFL